MRTPAVPIACLTILLTCLPASPSALRAEGVTVATGSVVIEAHDPEVLIIVDGEGVVEITDVQTGRTVRLDPNTLELVLGKDENQIGIPAGQFTLKRGPRPIATIRRTEAQQETQNRAAVPAGRPAVRPEQTAWADHPVGMWRELAGHSRPISAVQFSPDGKTVVSAGWDSTVRLWDVADGRQLWATDRRQIRSQIGTAAVTSDGRHVLIGTGGGRVLILDARTGRTVRELDPEGGGVTALAVLPDGQRMLVSALTGNTGRDNLTWLVDVTTGRTIRTFKHPMDRIQDLRVSRDGRFAICAGGYSPRRDSAMEGVVTVWELSSGKAVFTYDPDVRSEVPVAALSPDGMRVLSPLLYDQLPGEEPKDGKQSWLALWDVETGQKLREFPQYDRVLTAAFSPDGRRAICGTSLGAINVFSTESGELIHSFGGGNDGRRRVDSLDVSPDGRLVVSGHGDGVVRLWRLPDATHQPTPTEQPPKSPPQTAAQPGAWTAELREKISRPRPVLTLAISPDGRRALSCEHATLRLWDLSSGRELREFQGTLAAHVVRDIAWSPDGRFALLGAGQGPTSPRLTLWDVEKWQEVRQFEGHSHPPTRVAFSPDGRRALSGTTQGEVFAWDVASGRRISDYDAPIDWATCLAFSPDGRFGLVAGRQVADGQGGGTRGDDRLRVFEVESGREVRVFEKPQSHMVGAAFSEDGRRVVSVGFGGLVNVWDVARGTSLREFRVASDRVGRTAAAFSEDGRQVLIGGFYGSVHLWDVETGKQLADLTPTLESEREVDRLRSRTITDLDFTLKTGFAVFGRGDTTVQVWNLRKPARVGERTD